MELIRVGYSVDVLSRIMAVRSFECETFDGLLGGGIGVVSGSQLLVYFT